MIHIYLIYNIILFNILELIEHSTFSYNSNLFANSMQWYLGHE